MFEFWKTQVILFYNIQLHVYVISNLLRASMHFALRCFAVQRIDCPVIVQGLDSSIRSQICHISIDVVTVCGTYLSARLGTRRKTVN